MTLIFLASICAIWAAVFLAPTQQGVSNYYRSEAMADAIGRIALAIVATIALLGAWLTIYLLWQ